MTEEGNLIKHNGNSSNNQEISPKTIKVNLMGAPEGQVGMTHHLGTINFDIKFHANPSNSGPKKWTDRPTDIAIQTHKHG